MNEKTVNEPETGDMVIASIDTKTPVMLFGNGQALEIFKKIEAHVLPMVFDLTTDKGKKALKSVDRKIAGAKNKTDLIAKTYVAELEEKVRPVKAVRSQIKKLYEALQEKIKEPLVELERQEAEAKQEATQRIQEITAMGDSIQDGFELTIEQLESKGVELENVVITSEEFGDWVGEALKAKEIAEQTLKTSLQAARNLVRTKKLEDENRVLREKVAKQQPSTDGPQSAADVMAETFPPIGDVDVKEGIVDALAKEAERTSNDDEAVPALDPVKVQQKAIRQEALAELVSFGFNKEMCIQFIGAIHLGKVPHITINYPV